MIPNASLLPVHRRPRRRPAPVPAGELTIASPPRSGPVGTQGWPLLLPLLSGAGSLPLLLGSPSSGRRWILLGTVASLLLSTGAGLGLRLLARRAAERARNRERARYLDHLQDVARAAERVAALQRAAAEHLHPDVAALAPLVDAADRVWERSAAARSGWPRPCASTWAAIPWRTTIPSCSPRRGTWRSGARGWTTYPWPCPCAASGSWPSAGIRRRPDPWSAPSCCARQPSTRHATCGSWRCSRRTPPRRGTGSNGFPMSARTWPRDRSWTSRGAASQPPAGERRNCWNGRSPLAAPGLVPPRPLGRVTGWVHHQPARRTCWSSSTGTPRTVPSAACRCSMRSCGPRRRSTPP